MEDEEEFAADNFRILLEEMDVDEVVQAVMMDTSSDEEEVTGSSNRKGKSPNKKKRLRGCSQPNSDVLL